MNKFKLPLGSFLILKLKLSYLFLDKLLVSNAESQICLIFTVLFAKRMIETSSVIDVTSTPEINILCKVMAGFSAVIVFLLNSI